MCALFWLTWPELAPTRVMWVAVRIAVVPPHCPSRGAPPRGRAARGLLPTWAWLVPERGRLPAPHLYRDFAGGVRPRAVRLESAGDAPSL